MILVFLIFSFKTALSPSSFTLIKRLFSSSLLSAIRVVSSAYLRLLLILLPILSPACKSSSPAFLMMCSVYRLNKQGDIIQPCCTPFSILNQSVVPYRGSSGFFLTHIQVSQETGKMVWYSHLFKSFPLFVMIHTVKGFSIVDETEVDVFLELSCFLYDPANAGNLISGSSAFSKPSLNIWKFMLCIMLKPSMQDFKHDLTRMGDECNCLMVRTFLSTNLLVIGSRIDIFQSCGHGWVFQIC